MKHRDGAESLFNLCVNRKRRPYQVRVHCVGLMISHLVYI